MTAENGLPKSTGHGTKTDQKISIGETMILATIIAVAAFVNSMME